MATSLDYNVKFSHAKCGDDQLKKAIYNVWAFLKDFIPLANTHGGDFLSQKHWEKFIPSSIRQELLTLTEEELVNLPLRKCKTLPSEFQNAHETDKSESIDVEAAGHSRNCLNSRRSEKVESHQLVSECNVQGDISNASAACNNDGLDLFVSKAFGCHLENLGVLTSSEEATSGPNQSNSIITEAMSQKKCHEVKVMSNTVSTMVRACKADLVVDAGSGRGYLSMELADHQGICVLGLDSSPTNTHGAMVRKDKLKPRWSGLVAKEDRKNRDEKNQKEVLDHCCETEKVNENLCGELPKACNGSTDTKTVETSSLYVPLTMNVSPEMNLQKLLSDHAANLCGVCRKEDETKVILTGLHSCGSLAVSIMRLLVQDAGAVGMCCVGCCYQLLDEQSQECEGDFPLSQYGKSLNLCLGHNARNLASQSIYRLLGSRRLQGQDFYWRALLDVLIRDLNLPVPERIVGMRKLNKRSRTLYEYVVKALEIVGVESDMITPEMVQTLEEKYQDDQVKMGAYFQFKLVLAPVIESLILLDRLLFLIEQECISQAFLVKLFDPVTSPRCYALLAYK